MRLTLSLTACLALLAPGLSAAAQDGNMFAAAVMVNERAVTRYEVAQREALLSLLSGPGDHHDEAIKGLIDDRLRLAEAARYGLVVGDTDLKNGMEEFAARSNLKADEFLQKLQQGGVDPQTFRDFVKAGLAWRAVVSATIAPTVKVSDADIQDARALSLAHGVPRVLLSELILPGTPEYIGQTGPLAEQLSATLKGDAAFAAAAQQYSVSDSAKNGGKIDWIPVSNLPQSVVTAIISLSPGQVSKPLALPNAIGIFELRGLADANLPPAAQINVDYMEYQIPDIRTPEGAAALARVHDRTTGCGDLYGLAKGAPEGTLTRVSQGLPAVPADVALELAKLDPGEVSTTIRQGPNTVLLMLCSRTVTENPPPTQEALRNALFNDRVNTLADAKLDQLRAAANIRTP
jgi:peptidyl-prolyl cis-trans isomerase SurA